MNESCVTVTPRTQFGDSVAAWRADKATGRAHGKLGVAGIGIATVTVIAMESVVGMDVGRKGFGGGLKPTAEQGVALHAAIFRCQRQAQHKKAGQEESHRKYPRSENTDR